MWLSLKTRTADWSSSCVPSGRGRVYHLTVAAQDLAGNEVAGTATCTVPHEYGKGK